MTKRTKCDVLFIAGNSRSLIANRGDLIREIQAKGQSVAVIVPEHDYLDETAELGVEIHRISMKRTSTNPIGDLKYTLALIRLIRRIMPQAVFSYTAKPVIYGSMAALIARVPARFSMITGLGHIYTTTDRKNKIVRPVMNMLYSLGIGASHKIFFQNPDDLEQFTQAGILKDPDKAVRTNGSGVDLERFREQPLPSGSPMFLFVGRLLTEKGIREFAEAAEQVKEKYPKARFVAVGPYDPSLPHSVPAGLVSRWADQGTVEFVGAVKDVRQWLKECTVLVLPSYREGTPRAVLEALATGRAVITTDTPGCRETVEHGVNGLLAEPKSTHSLAAAMEHLLANPSVLSRMAKQSRRKAEEKYDVRKVNKVILETMKL
jgi:glycosyltransferase involved in cell wall biosynthesis